MWKIAWAAWGKTRPMAIRLISLVLVFGMVAWNSPKVMAYASEVKDSIEQSEDMDIPIKDSDWFRSVPVIQVTVPTSVSFHIDGDGKTSSDEGIITNRGIQAVDISFCGFKSKGASPKVVAPDESIRWHNLGTEDTASMINLGVSIAGSEPIWSEAQGSGSAFIPTGEAYSLKGTDSTSLSVAARHGNAWKEKTNLQYNAYFKLGLTYVPITGVEISDERIDLLKGGSKQLFAEAVPFETSEDSEIKWSSDKESVVTVTQTGYVTARGNGSATITAMTKSGKYATCLAVVTTPVSGVTLNRSSLSLSRGETETLTATVNPSDASNKGVTWSTSDSSVAAVTNGTVTAVGAGNAVITATTADGGHQAHCDVSVSVPVAGVSLNQNTMSLNRGGSGQLAAVVSPSDASDQNVRWSSSNTGVATVSNGRVEAVGAGSAVITVTTEDGGYQARCSVTVSVPVSGITLNQNGLYLNRGTNGYLTATVLPGDASNKNVSWSSSNTSVATVSNGTVYAAGAGTATITATTEDGSRQASCTVIVSVPVSGISLNQSNLYLNRGANGYLTATVSPGDASNKNVSWSSSNTSVAAVSNGTVYAAGAGTATITATTVDGSKQAACVVTVSVPVTDVSLNQTALALNRGQSGQLTATITPWDATNKGVAWSSNNPAVATVNNGTVYAAGAGLAVITVTTADGGKQANCLVSVTVPVTGITLDRSTAELKEGEATTLSATVAPWDASNKDVTWSTSDGTIATVSGGLVTGVKSGAATITASCAGYTTSCSVTVKSRSLRVTNVKWAEAYGARFNEYPHSNLTYAFNESYVSSEGTYPVDAEPNEYGQIGLYIETVDAIGSDTLTMEIKNLNMTASCGSNGNIGKDRTLLVDKIRVAILPGDHIVKRSWQIPKTQALFSLKDVPSSSITSANSGKAAIVRCGDITTSTISIDPGAKGFSILFAIERGNNTANNSYCSYGQIPWGDILINGKPLEYAGS